MTFKNVQLILIFPMYLASCIQLFSGLKCPTMSDDRLHKVKICENVCFKASTNSSIKGLLPV